MYRRGSIRMLKPLSPDTGGVPLIVDHDTGRQVGWVEEIRSDWNAAPQGT